MAKILATIIDNYRSENSTLSILDMGCGEGYYCRQIEAFCKHSEKLNIHGIDITKNAILVAAKKQAYAHFIVASNKRMPFADEYLASFNFPNK